MPKREDNEKVESGCCDMGEQDEVEAQNSALPQVSYYE